MSKLPVTEIKDLATAVALTANAADAVMADGSVDAKDIVHVSKLLGAVRAYGSVDFKQVIPQAADIDTQEAAELAAHFASVFNLKNDSIEATVERGLALVLQGVEAIRAVWDVIQSVRGKLAA